MYHPTINPHDAQEVLVSCDMTGAYISHDGGQSWRMFNLRGGVHFFVFDPIDPHTIYAGTKALWRSTDDGASWKLIWPKPSTIRGIQMSSDHADETIITSGNPLGNIVTLAIDPSDPHTLIVGATNAGNATVFIPRDSGAKWEKLSDLPEAPDRIWIDPNSGKEDRDLYLSEKHGLSVRTHGKWQYRHGPAGVTFTDMSAGFSALHGQEMMLYATSPAGIFLSHDGGASWTASPLSGKGAEVRIGSFRLTATSTCTT